MGEPSKPAEHYRTLFWDLIPHCRVGGERRSAGWIEKQLLGFGGGPGDRLGRHIFATGLLAHGQLEAAETILDSIPLPQEDPGGKVLFFGSNALRAMLPLPDELRGEVGWYSQVRIEAVRTWLHQHRDELKWDEVRGRFVLGEG